MAMAPGDLTRLPCANAGASYKVNTLQNVLESEGSKKDGEEGLLDGFGAHVGSLLGTGSFFWHFFVQPFFEQFLGTRSQVAETQSDASFEICPRHFRFNIHREGGSRQRKLQTGIGILGKSLVHQERHASLADVSAGGFYSLVVHQYLHQHLHGLAVVAATLPHHETQRRIETAGRIQNTDGLLQNKIHAHGKRFLRGGFLAIQNGKGYGVLVTGGGTHALQYFQAPSQIVTVNDYGIEL